MPQSLIQMPESAIMFSRMTIHIRNHRVQYGNNLFGWAMWSIHGKEWEQAVSEMEKHGITYEVFIEYIVAELEQNHSVFAQAIKWHYDIRHPNWKEYSVFSASETGRKITQSIIDGIRDCENWKQVHDTMNQQSRFYKDIKKTINREVERIINDTKHNTSTKDIKYRHVRSAS